MRDVRQHAGYAAGQSCPEELIDLLSLPEQNARVEAILAIGGTRAQEALYTPSPIMTVPRTQAETSGFR